MGREKNHKTKQALMTTTTSHNQSVSHKNRTKKHRPRRSQADIMATAFLKNTFAPIKKSMMLAWFLDVLSVLMLVGQMFALASIFNGWLLLFLPSGKQVQWDNQQFWLWLLVLLACLLGRAFLGFWRESLLSRVGLSVVKTVRSRLFDKLQLLGLARREFGADGVLASKIIDEPDHLMGYARFEVQKMTAVTAPLILLGCVGVYHAGVAWILFATAPFVPIAMAVIGIATAAKNRQQMDALAQLGGRFLDWVRGIDTLSRLAATDAAIKDIRQSSENYRKRTMDVLKIAFLNSAVLELISAFSIAMVAVYLGFALLGKPMFGGAGVDYWTALFILLLVPEFYAPLRKLGAEYHVKGQALACAKALAPMLSAKSTAHHGAMHQLQSAPTFALKNVAVFGDDGRIRLSPVSLTFVGGRRTALVGQSGVGKSTILQVLLGFGEHTGDVVLTDGETTFSYQQLRIQSVRKQFAYLSQTSCLLPISIADNLRLVKPAASDDELKDVLQKVQLWQTIQALPDGINSKLAEKGAGLSGGQAKRLTIAQLLLQNAKVWLLDEPTEHLDSQTASHIHKLLFELSADKTVIWVTHQSDLSAFDDVIHLGVNKETSDE